MRVIAQDHAIRDQLVIEHVGLVKAAAHRLAQRLPSQVEVSDLISVGVIGLIDAAGRYRPAMGVPFDAYARRRVQGAMLDALRELDWAPRSLRRLRREVDKTMARLRAETGDEPDDRELATAMGVSEDELRHMLEQLRSLELAVVRQLDEPGPDGTPLLDMCLDPGDLPDARLYRSELSGHLAKALEELPERERQVLALYYQEEMTLAEIGAVFGVGESRISQIRSLAISRLRTLLRTALRIPERD